MGKGLIQEGHVDEVERHRVGLGVLLVGALRGLELPTCAPPRQRRDKTQHRAHATESGWRSTSTRAIIWALTCAMTAARAGAAAAARLRCPQGRAPCALPSAVLPSRVSGDTRKGWQPALESWWFEQERTFAAWEKRSRKSVGLGCFMSKLSFFRISFSMSMICQRDKACAPSQLSQNARSVGAGDGGRGGAQTSWREEE